MERRAFVVGALSLLATPLAAEAQSLAARIGLLAPAEEPRFSEIASGLKQGLREQGYRDDTIHVVEGRTRRGDEAGAGAGGEPCPSRREHDRHDVRVSGAVRQAAGVAP